MEFRLLGPLEALRDDTPVRIAAGKQRALLAVLLLNANRTVSREQLIDALWGDDVPDSAQKMVQIQVSQLRKALPDQRLHTRGSGYVLDVREDELDVARFERAVADARRLAEHDPEGATDRLGHALALWRGPALAEFSEPFARHEGARLEELRLAAVELQIEGELALGRERDVVGELGTLVGLHPLRERLRSQHMLALYRSGRHAEALASYQAFRRSLGEELGIEPSASLRELERKMLQQDPSLDAASASPAVGTVTAEDVGDVAYARSGDIRIAYQIVGDGPVDLVLVHGWVCTFQPGWEYANLAAFYRQLASMGRLILFDKRGTGLSDRVSPERLPDLETRMDDVRAVLDAVGSERAVLVGLSEGGPMSALFAATYPERTLSLVLIGTFPREMWAPDYHCGITEEALGRRLALLEEDDWAAAATRDWLGRVAPDVLRDPTALRWYTSYVQRGTSPGAMRALRLMNVDIDVRDVLPTISVPTLVLHRARESWRDGSRFMGEHIPGARLIELPGEEHLPWEGDRGALIGEIERFLSGVEEEVEPDRVLATLLLTGIVDTEAGAGAGRDLRAKHDRLVRALLARFRGREVEMLDDGVFATFDGPARAVRCASAIAEGVKVLGLDVRAGVHTGEIEQTVDGVRGMAVRIATRIAAAARPGEILVSGTVKDIVAGSGIVFDERAERHLHGVPGMWRLFSARV
jgi:DNA-binding SARP family transcriptional activator/class 3 adenylate cyclase